MADFDKSKFDPKAAAEARKAEMEEITGKLEKGVKDIFKTENYKEYLNFCAKLPRYSVNNQILIMLQKPNATMCQSFTGWKEMNRFVRKGEKGIRILAPSPYKMQKEQDKTDASGKTVLDKDGEPVKETVEITVNAFKPVSTFDVSQTEGEPLPTIGVSELTGSVEGYETLLAAIKEASTRFGDISKRQKELEARLAEIAALKKHIINYSKTREIYAEYRKNGYSKKFFEEHREEITLHKAAKEAFSQIKGPLPKIRELNEEYERVLREKKKTYADYRQARQDMKDYQTVKYNVEQFLRKEEDERQAETRKRTEQVR